MTPQERKAVGYIVRQACDHYAAVMGSRPIYENRDQMRDHVGQMVDADLAGLDSPGALAEWLIAANKGAAR